MLVGLTASTKNPPEHKDGPPSTTQQEDGKAAQPVPTPPANTYKPYPTIEDGRCYQAADHDAADLCAQWRAAIAAEKGADAAIWSNYVSGVSALLSFVSILLVLAALLQGRRANHIAQRSVDAVERPYLVVEITGQNFKGTDAPQGYLGVAYRIKNIGGSPAQIELLHDSLNFEEPGREDRWLGGSNIYIIEKGEAGPDMLATSAQYTQDQIEAAFDQRSLILRVNFSYLDLMKNRRNVYFVKAYGKPPFDRWHWNYLPEVEDAPLDPHKWRRRRDKLRLWAHMAHVWILGMPRDSINPDKEGAPPFEDRSPEFLRWVKAGFRRPPPRE